MRGQRRRLDADGWGEVMRRFDAAATPVDAFCAREGLSSSSFYRWRERLQRDGAPAKVPRTRASGIAVAAPSGFIELGELAHATRRTETGVHVRLDLGSGLVLQITRA